jgi:DNA-directed RNA polymerase subunit RPC12/RpoP
VDVGGVVRSEDRVRCPECNLWLGNLVVFQDSNDWTCPNCGVRFGIIVF